MRKLALDHVQRFLPSFKREQVLDLWISHPLPSLKSFVKETIEANWDKIKRSTLSATLVMLDEIDLLLEIDPDLVELEHYLQTLDPSLGSLIFERAGKLSEKLFKKKRLRYVGVSKPTIAELLSKKDFNTLWKSVLEYPFPFVSELMKILNKEDWRPESKESRYFFELLSEYLGENGWDGVSWILNLAITKEDKKTGEFEFLSEADRQSKFVEINVTQIVYTRPDRIPDMEFVDRGRFNLVDRELNLAIYDERVRYSNFTGKLHIPVYSTNGILLAEIVAHANSVSSFLMDEDGLYITIKSKGQNYSVDMDTLAMFLIPLNQHTHLIDDSLQTLISSLSGLQKRILETLKLLTDLHHGRSFNVFDIKESEPLQGRTPHGCCTLGIDFGNTETKISIVPSDCGHELLHIVQPTVVSYITPDQFLVGDEISMENSEVVNSDLTMFNLKQLIQEDSLDSIRVRNLTITPRKATEDFLRKVIKRILAELKYSVQVATFTFEKHTTVEYRRWFHNFLTEFGFNQIYGLEASLASTLASFRAYKEEGKSIVLDLGDTHITGSLVDIPSNKSRKRKIDSLLEGVEEAPISSVSLSLGKGMNSYDNEISTHLSKLNINRSYCDYKVFSEIKQTLSKEFELTEEKYTESPLKIKILGEPKDKSEVIIDEENSVFIALQFLMRDLLAIISEENFELEKLNQVILSGGGANWPLFQEYIYNLLDKKVKLIVEDNKNHLSLGAGIFGNGQNIISNPGDSIQTNTASSGMLSLLPLIDEKEGIYNEVKKIEVKKNFEFHSLILDLWIKRLNYSKIQENDINILKTELLTTEFFDFEPVLDFPLIVDTKDLENPVIRIGVRDNGWLCITVSEKDVSPSQNDYIELFPII